MLRESGIEFEKINYFIEPLGEAKLRELIAKMRLAPRQLLRTNEAAYRELGDRAASLSDDEIIALMVEHPQLVQRPILERGDRAVLGRPIENIEQLLHEE